MKKTLLLLSIFATPVFADIAVTPGVGKTVATDSVNSREYQTIKIIDGTSAGTSSMTVTSGGAALVTSSGMAASQQGTWTVQPGNTQNTTPWQTVSTYTVMTDTFSVPVAISGSISNTGFNVNNSPTVNPGNTQNTTAWIVTSSGTSIQTVTPGSGTFTVSGTVTANPGNTQNTTAWQVVSTNTIVTSTQTNNGVAASGNRLGTLPAISQSAYANNGTAYTQGRDAAISILINSGAVPVVAYPDSTYNCYSVGITSATTYANTTDIACLVGNGSNKVIAPYFVITGTQTTAGMVPISIMKRSTLDVTSSVSTMTATALSSSYSVAVSSVVLFTASPALGTLVGSPMNPAMIGMMATATATPNDIYISPSSWKINGPQLRSATEELCVSLTTTTVTGGNLRIGINWCEVSAP